MVAAASQVSTGPSDRTRSRDSSLDHWFYAGMALLFFVTALLGFVPNSIEKLDAVAAGLRPPLPLAQHVHAVVMGSWILLLLAQTFLVSAGRTNLHRRLGLASFALVPAIVLVMILVTQSTWAIVAAIPAGAFPAAELAASKALIGNVLFEQLKVLILFPLFAGWAIAVRRTDPEMHKRMMILATLMPLSAGIDRIALRWLPTNFPTGYEVEYLYLLVWLAPALVYDLWRRGRVHRAYVIGIACNLPFFVLNYFVWGSPQWLELAPRIMGVSGW